MKPMSKRFRTLLGGGLILLFSLESESGAGAQTCAPPPSGLVSWWPGDGNADDITGGNDGMLQNGATFAPGKVGQAFSFDGVNAFVEIPNSAPFNPGSAFTIDGWFYIDPNALSNAGDAATLVSKSDYQDTGGGWLLLFEDRTIAGVSKALSFQVYQGQAAFVVAEAQNVVATADWYHIAGVFDATATPRAKLYLNGNLIGSSTTSISGVTPNNLNLRIGAAYCNDPNCTGSRNDRFNGLADEIEFFNVALTQAQIQGIFNAGSAGKCKPATGLDHFKCYKAKGEAPNVAVDLEDQFGVEPGVLVKKPELFCNPVNKNGEGIRNLAAHLTCYKIKADGEKRDVVATNQFGEQTLEVKKPELLCVPSDKFLP